MRSVIEDDVELAAQCLYPINICAVSGIATKKGEAFTANVREVGNVETGHMRIREVFKPHVDAWGCGHITVNAATKFRPANGQTHLE